MLRPNAPCPLFVVLLALLCVGGPVPALATDLGPAADDAAVERLLVGEALLSGRAREVVLYLADRIGPRVTGGEACARAAAWAAARLRLLGLDVQQERYPVKSPWTAGPQEIMLTAPIVRRLDGLSLSASGGTPQGGLTGPVVALTPAEIAGQGARLRGAVVLLLPPYARGFGPLHVQILQVADALLRAGALGLLLYAPTLAQPKALPMTGDGTVSRLPAVLLSYADGLLVRRLASEGETRVRLRLGHHIGPPVQERNIVAEIPGTARPHEVVLLHAHLDSVYSAPGATDDAAGIAVVMEAARLLRTLAPRPRRTLRFVLFTGEEQGFLGARAYVTRHRAELDSIVAVVAVDSGAGRITAFDPLGRDDLVPRLRATLRPPFLPGIGVTEGAGEPPAHSNSAPFFFEGVPSIDAVQEDHDYFAHHHRPTDTADKVDAHDLALISATLALLTLRLANAEERLGPRLLPERVRALLHAARAEDDLRYLGYPAGPW